MGLSMGSARTGLATVTAVSPSQLRTKMWLSFQTDVAFWLENVARQPRPT